MCDIGKSDSVSMRQLPSDHESLYAYVVALTMACPLNQDNPPGCPLYKVRLEPGIDRIKWVKSLGTDRLRNIAEQHCACLRAKEFLQSML